MEMNRVFKTFLLNGMLALFGSQACAQATPDKPADNTAKDNKKHVLVVTSEMTGGDTTETAGWSGHMARIKGVLRKNGLQIHEIGDVDQNMFGYEGKKDSLLSLIEKDENRYFLYYMAHGITDDKTFDHKSYLGYYEENGRKRFYFSNTMEVLQPYYERSVVSGKPLHAIIGACEAGSLGKGIKKTDQTLNEWGFKGFPDQTQFLICSHAGDVTIVGNTSGLKLIKEKTRKEAKDLFPYYMAYNSSIAFDEQNHIVSGATLITKEKKKLFAYSAYMSIEKRLGKGLSARDIRKLKTPDGDDDTDEQGYELPTDAMIMSYHKALKGAKRIEDLSKSSQANLIKEMSRIKEKFPLYKFNKSQEGILKKNRMKTLLEKQPLTFVPRI